MKLITALKLGRVSNLPTLWTNTLVGLAFGGASLLWDNTLLACVMFSLFYLAGMYLNDVFDANWDRQYQQTRPIPAGETSVKEVLVFALVYLLLAFALLFILSAHIAASFLLAVLLLAFIVLYDWKHKHWPTAAPLIMGGCRMCVYLCAASLFQVWQWSLPLLFAALSLLLYIAGITALARAEHSNTIASLKPLILLFAPFVCALALGYQSTHCILVTFFALAWTVRAAVKTAALVSVAQAIAALLAGITLVDAAFLFALDYQLAAWFCLGAFLLCLLLQKKVAAT